MATFTQWARQAAEVKRVTWVCGSERILVEEVVDSVRANLHASDMDYVSLVAGSSPDREIWAALNQYPFDPKANRLVLVRDVERVKRWAPFLDWMANSRLLPTNYALFVSSSL